MDSWLAVNFLPPPPQTPLATADPPLKLRWRQLIPLHSLWNHVISQNPLLPLPQKINSDCSLLVNENWLLIKLHFKCFDSTFTTAFLYRLFSWILFLWRWVLSNISNSRRLKWNNNIYKYPWRPTPCYNVNNNNNNNNNNNINNTSFSTFM